RAVRNSLVLLALIVLVPFLVYVGWGRGIFLYVGLFSPLVLLVRAGDAAYTTSPKLFWFSLFAVHLASWFLFVTAGRRLIKAALNEGGSTGLRKVASPQKAARAIGLGVWQPVKE